MFAGGHLGGCCAHGIDDEEDLSTVRREIIEYYRHSAELGDNNLKVVALDFIKRMSARVRGAPKRKVVPRSCEETHRHRFGRF